MAKKNIIVRLQNWMDSVAGQTFLNYAYSWGASIVILGTLFKLLHYSGADIMLCLGMGTEVIVFFLAAFDRPFDKNEIGKEMPEDYDILEDDDDEVTTNANAAYMPSQPSAAPQMAAQPYAGVIPVAGQQPMASAQGAPNVGVQGGVDAANLASAISGLAATEEMLAAQKSAINNPELESATNDYVQQLKQLTEVLGQVAQQSSRITEGSAEMETLNRTIASLSSVYDTQLRSAGMQMATIDQINEQTRRMAVQIQELNNVYARMLQALTVTAPQYYQQQPQYQQPYQPAGYQQPAQPYTPQQPLQK